MPCSVTLKSADPKDDPVCLFNYFKDPRDMAEMVDAYKTGLDLLTQPSFDQVSLRLFSGSCEAVFRVF